MRGIGLGCITTLITSAALSAQSSDVAGREGPRAVLDRDREVALALSAAPAAVSAGATVLVWSGEDFVVAREGSNGVRCIVGRSWPESLEPHCFDEEGSRTVLPIHMHQTVLRHRGMTQEEISASVAEGLRTGRFRLPTRPAMSYMMSAGQELIGDDGRSAGAWRPHLMIYFPYLGTEDLGLGPTPSTEAAIVVDPGSALSNIMIVVEDFVPVVEAGGPPSG